MSWRKLLTVIAAITLLGALIYNFFYDIGYDMGSSSSAKASRSDPAPNPLAGQWTIDLRLSLDDPAYTQPMLLKIAEDNSVSGNFYGSPIETGRFGEAQGRQCVAFNSSDSSSSYQHSACLEDGALVGVSWNEQRAFVLPWTATKD